MSDTHVPHPQINAATASARTDPVYALMRVLAEQKRRDYPPVPPAAYLTLTTAGCTLIAALAPEAHSRVFALGLTMLTAAVGYEILIRTDAPHLFNPAPPGTLPRALQPNLSRLLIYDAKRLEIARILLLQQRPHGLARRMHASLIPLLLEYPPVTAGMTPLMTGVLAILLTLLATLFTLLGDHLRQQRMIHGDQDLLLQVAAERSLTPEAPPP